MIWTGCLGDGESIALAFHSLLKIKIVHARSVDIQGPASRLWKLKADRYTSEYLEGTPCAFHLDIS